MDMRARKLDIYLLLQAEYQNRYCCTILYDTNF